MKSMMRIYDNLDCSLNRDGMQCPCKHDVAVHHVRKHTLGAEVGMKKCPRKKLISSFDIP